MGGLSDGPADRIEWLEFRYDGLLKGQRFEFAAGVTANIGGNGSGKTTSLQGLRHSLGCPARGVDEETFAELLASNVRRGEIAVGFVAGGKRYTSTRTASGTATITDASGEVVDASVDGEFFGIEMYSQDELKTIGLIQSAQLPMIDAFRPGEIRRFSEAIAETKARLNANKDEILRKEQDLAELKGRIDDLPSVREALKASSELTSEDDAATKRMIDANDSRIRERGVVAEAIERLRSARAALDAFDRARVRRSPESERRPPTTETDKILAGVDESVRAAMTAFENASRTMNEALSRSDDIVAGQAKLLAAEHAPLDARYEKWRVGQVEHRERLEKRDTLQKRLVELEATERRAHHLREELQGLRAERERQRALLGATREKRSLARKEIGTDLTTRLEGVIRVDVSAGDDLSAYRKLLGDIVTGARFHADYLDRIVKGLTPDALVRCVETGDYQEIVKLDPKSSKLERAQKLLQTITLSGRLFELDAVEVEDVPTISLRIGKTYKNSRFVSGGQRALCVLTVALLSSTFPLIIDQPEDALGNEYLVGAFLKALDVARQRRQIIINTHSAIIVVNGKADRVNVLAFEDECSRITHAGSLEQVVGRTEELLDGGHDAIIERIELYMGRGKKH